MLGNIFGFPIIVVSDEELDDPNIIFRDFSGFINHMTDQDFNRLLEESGLTEDKFIEKLIDDGWQIGLDGKWNNEYWKEV